ncbi:MAG: hypothetical protein HZC41_25100 [Chloroflexi bacterium]|nr:hypothetical protein [Chloroflexota bacterium]
MRRTVKYQAAIEQAKQLNIRSAGHLENDALYAKLGEAGLTWNNRTGEWVKKPEMEDAPDGAPGIVRVRITANKGEIDDVVDWFVRGANSAGAKVQDVSDPYPNTRKGTGCRVYITLDMDGCF